MMEALPLYALGLLEPDDAHTVEAHLAGGCELCAAELISLRETAAEIPYAFSGPSPSPGLKEKIMARIAAPAPQKGFGAEEKLPGIFVIKKAAGKWKKTPWPGVSYKTLFVDPKTDYATTLLKLEAGGAYPAHRHADVELCLVLEGKVRLGEVAVEAGDFEYALAGTDHGVVQSDEGCLLLIVASQHDEIFA